MNEPLYPSPGTETDLNEPGHYIGWFQNFPFGYGSQYDFVPPVGWSIVNQIPDSAGGTHGGCPT